MRERQIIDARRESDGTVALRLYAYDPSHATNPNQYPVMFVLRPRPTPRRSLVAVAARSLCTDMAVTAARNYEVTE